MSNEILRGKTDEDYFGCPAEFSLRENSTGLVPMESSGFRGRWGIFLVAAF